jgi:hypothetical protein
MRGPEPLGVRSDCRARITFVRDCTDLCAEHMSNGNIVYWSEVIVVSQGHVKETRHALTELHTCHRRFRFELWSDHLDRPADARCRILKVHRSTICSATNQFGFITTALLLSRGPTPGGSFVTSLPRIIARRRTFHDQTTSTRLGPRGQQNSSARPPGSQVLAPGSNLCLGELIIAL